MPFVTPRLLVVALVTSLSVFGCAASKSSSGPGPSTDLDGGRGDVGDASFQIDSSPTGFDGAASFTAHLKGKVVAPEGTIPISGALVYTTSVAPPDIPDHVFCDKCVKLEDGTPYTTTKADGTFDLPTYTGSTLLVVQKGAFRRVRPLTVVAGDQDVPLALTTMPPKMDKAHGDDVPKIAIMLGAWDPIELVLARMGLAATVSKGFLGRAQVLSKDATGFAIYGLHDLGETSPYPAAITLISDPAEISKYHIVFIPCSGSSSSDPSGTGPQCDGTYGSSSKIVDTLDGFVKQGGRLYVSDWSYEYVRQIFPGYVSWQGESPTIGSACMAGGGEQPAKVDDPGLSAWLAAQGKDLSTVKDAWTDLTGVHAKPDLDADGKTVTVTPKVWVEATSAPATVSFEHSCGRVLFTTYHTQPTAESSAPLEPQALALLYLILEVDVCVGPPVIK
ncbi:MAG: hypothetical protein NVS3B10_04920 [Polyangiales bacterium]